ncbi:lysozyme-like [Bombyx mandarina]|uniref:Lysozyme n=1 Tax=Bombyx mandarina TaxID=7092 RepID=A0A6J2JM15_BOMMA|nr:lysozyme-like [Bombyx mandarina]
MAGGRAFLFTLIVLSLYLANTQCKVYTRCKLTRDLLKNNFPRTFISNWVCLIEQGSDRNTSALVVKSPRRKFYGLFQIGSEWCKEGRKGGKCDIPCEALLDEDIKDDGVCAIKIFEQEGFKYWPKWEVRCKGQTLPDIEKCPDWQLPPSRASPPRDKRYLKSDNSYKLFRGRRNLSSIRNKIYLQ